MIVWLFSLKPGGAIRGMKGESRECLPCLPATGSFIKPASINIRQNSTATRRPIEVMNVRTRLENKEFHARPRTCAPDARGFTRDMSDTRDVISIVRFDPPLLHALIAFYRADAITFERCVAHTKAGRILMLQIFSENAESFQTLRLIFKRKYLMIHCVILRFVIKEES